MKAYVSSTLGERHIEGKGIETQTYDQTEILSWRNRQKTKKRQSWKPSPNCEANKSSQGSWSVLSKTLTKRQGFSSAAVVPGKFTSPF